MKLGAENSTAGSYAVTTLVPGKKHLLRLANVGINNYLHVSLDGHKFTIVSADFVAINPIEVEDVILAVGQRYNVIIEAKADVSNYWLRVRPGDGRRALGACDGPNAQGLAGNTKAIFKYAGAPDGNPTSTAPATLPTGCYDQAGIVPYRKRTLPSKNLQPRINATFSNVNGGLVQWLVDGSAIQIDFERPTLQYIMKGETPPPRYNVININGAETNVSFLDPCGRSDDLHMLTR